MMRKKEVYTNITPLPSFIPRQLALDILHSHSEIITLNPLVLNHHAIEAPRNASADEYYSTWYEIIERIQYIPGLGRMGSGKISFRGCFHDVPWGLQTHVYAPMGVDIRNNWRVAGNQPGEPPEHMELGLGAPKDGLYLREDIEIKCNITLVSFVKQELKASTKVLVDRLIKKAELLEAGVLQAMMDNGKLKTVNPADRSRNSQQQQQQQQQAQQTLSPGMQYQYPRSPTFDHTRPGTAGTTSTSSDYKMYAPMHQFRSTPSPKGPIAMELPGDTYYYHPTSHAYLQPPLHSPHKMMRDSITSNQSDPSGTNTGTWSDYNGSTSSRPTSYSSDGGFRSPPLDQKSFAAELPTMTETREEHSSNAAAALKALEARSELGPKHRYNPQDYADVSGRYQTQLH